MLILDKPKVFRGSELRIPLYHRGHLSLLAGTRIWLCLLPGTKSPSHIPEIIISPIHFDSWSDLWRIEATLNERVGVVHKILRVLREHSVNVLAQESSSIDRQLYHTIELIIDARRHNSMTDCDSGKRSLGIIDAMPDLQRALLAELTDSITFWPTGAPRLKISRMKGLHEAAQAFDIAHRNYMGGLGFRPTVEHTNAQVKDARGWIQLPNDITGILDETLWPTGRPQEQNLQPLRYPSYLLVSDTKERYLRAYFLRPTDALLSVAIEHEEKIGALATITDALQQHNFNILTSLSRLYTHGGRAQYELVLQPPPELSNDQDKMVKEFEKALGTRELISEYKIAVSYKANYTSPLDFKFVRENHRPLPSLPPEAPKSVEEILERHQSALAVRLRSVGASEEDMLRFTLSGKLLDEERRVRQAYRPRKILFLSFAFDHTSSYVSKALEEAEALGFEVTIGKGLKENVHRQGIIRLISGATAFLGIWTDEGAYRFGRKSWPSPWLHWELGVAAAQGLRPRLLISSTVHKDAWKVYPEVPNLIFDSSNFMDYLRETLGFLAADHI